MGIDVLYLITGKWQSLIHPGLSEVAVHDVTLQEIAVQGVILQEVAVHDVTLQEIAVHGEL